MPVMFFSSFGCCLVNGSSGHGLGYATRRRSKGDAGGHSTIGVNILYKSLRTSLPCKYINLAYAFPGLASDSEHGHQSFDKELALYDLLDLDADGDEDVDEFDEATEQILLGNLLR